MLTLPLLAIPLFILLGKSDFFLHHGASIWVQSNDAVFHMRGRNCEVLIFGDSTAMTGINPDLVQQQTGLRTCNIAITNAVLSVTGNLTLDHYLANNARPRVILVQFSPEGFQQAGRTWKRTIYAEGLLELLRHSSPQQWRRVLLTHPREAVAFAGYAAGFTTYYGLKRGLYHAAHITPDEDTVQVRNGFFTPPSPPRATCEPLAEPSISQGDPSPRKVVDHYLQYRHASSTVLVNVAPIPACDQNLQAYRQELSGITSNVLLALPIHFFNGQRHFTADGSQIVSRMISAQINAATGRISDDLRASINQPQVHAHSRHAALQRASNPVH